MGNKQFSVEEQIVLLCSRKMLSDEQYIELRELLLKKPDWGSVFRIAVFNKVMGLVSKHILHFNTDVLPGLIRRQLLFMNLGNKERNREMFSELSKVLSLLNESGIKYSPLKGAYIIPYVYEDYSVRLSNDIDILIKSSDIEKACAVMNEAGFVMGKYDDSTRTIIPAKRKDDIYWKFQMGNIHPFVKLSDNPFVDFLVIDFAFDVDPIHKNFEIAEKMLENTVVTEMEGTNTRLLNSSDFLIQVCTHLYKEACARHAAAETYSDINLIKFCDVRELILSQWDVNDDKAIEDLVDKASTYKVENALIYCIECCEYIYEDGFWKKLLEKLSKRDETSVNPVSINDNNFWNSIFRRKEQ